MHMQNYTVILMDWAEIDRNSRYVLLGHDQALAALVALKAIGKYQISTYELAANDYDEVFDILNTRHPKNYKGRSISPGDLIAGHEEIVQVTPFGFTRLTDVQEARVRVALFDLENATPQQLRRAFEIK